MSQSADEVLRSNCRRESLVDKASLLPFTVALLFLAIDVGELFYIVMTNPVVTCVLVVFCIAFGVLAACLLIALVVKFWSSHRLEPGGAFVNCLLALVLAAVANLACPFVSAAVLDGNPLIDPIFRAYGLCLTSEGLHYVTVATGVPLVVASIGISAYAAHKVGLIASKGASRLSLNYMFASAVLALAVQIAQEVCGYVSVPLLYSYWLGSASWSSAIGAVASAWVALKNYRSKAQAMAA